ncbi:unnamed protein product [Spirodela intermedia]|uniref:Reverse transcriptase Ty1/copia-type domain-containing protein n=2 Tax=Spirodela intermedia TaxID=51605 RepID=A0A7I8K3P2_SPIIN|nr:unnamed protein product [Spirodela intermedia]CAA6656249.1 unnamed protein product [Spirodela intermedia]CAA7391774.1 unnamed protein product [Spirodela intermedia]
MISYYLSLSNVSSLVTLVIRRDMGIIVPSSMNKALSHSSSRSMVTEEMQALELNATWQLVLHPSSKSGVGCKWVYIVKVGPDGFMDRLKVHLVAQGFTHMYGEDYFETFSPIAKITSFRFFSVLVVQFSWPLYWLDVKNAFLYRDLQEEAYME